MTSTSGENPQLLSSKRLSVFHHRSTGDLRGGDSNPSLDVIPPDASEGLPTDMTFECPGRTSPRRASEVLPEPPPLFQPLAAADGEYSQVPKHTRRCSESVVGLSRIQLPSNLAIHAIQELDEDGPYSPQMPRRHVQLPWTAPASQQARAVYVPDGVVVLDDQCKFVTPYSYTALARTSRSQSVVSLDPYGGCSTRESSTSPARPPANSRDSPRHSMPNPIEVDDARKACRAMSPTQMRSIARSMSKTWSSRKMKFWPMGRRSVVEAMTTLDRSLSAKPIVSKRLSQSIGDNLDRGV